MDDSDLEILQDLIVESNEHLSGIEPDLLALEKGGEQIDQELINRVFRAIHSIKGGFSFLGLERITELSHAMESVLMRLRDGELELNPVISDDLLKGTDLLQQMINDVDGSEQVDISVERSQLSRHLQAEQTDTTGSVGKVVAENAESQKVTPEPSTQTGAPQSEKQTEVVESIRVRVDLLNRLMNLAGELVLSRNQIKQALTARVVDSAAGNADIKRFYAQLRQAQDTLLSALNSPGSQETGANDLSALRSIVTNQFERIEDSFHQALNFPLVETPGLSSIMQNVDLVTSELQGNIMNTRMQPVGAVFAKFPRIIRDLSRKMGKQIELSLEGQEVELDKSIIEALADPLTHLIRNCADHAIEMPDERKAAGKPAVGRVLLRAYHESGQVNIEISDDGHGMDPQKIKGKAVEKGVLSTEAAERMSDKEALALIFAPGFSTAEQVSDISGRGVGMDVVRTNITNLGGTVDLDSSLGQGSCINLRLPLTLAIIPSLLVRTEGRRFAVPQVNLVEMVRVRARDAGRLIQTIQGKPTLRLRETLLPLVRLSDVLGIPNTYPENSDTLAPERRQLLGDRRNQSSVQANLSEEGNEQSVQRQSLQGRRRSVTSAHHVLVLKAGNHRYGLIVDQLLDNEEIVVKPLSSYLQGCKCYAGATIMGDGKVAMILDAKGIADEAGLWFGELEQDNAAAAADQQRQALIEKQPILMFRNGTSEQFAINLAMVARVEKIEASQTEKIGDREYVKYADHSLRILRLQDYLPVERPAEKPDSFFIIVPKLVKHPMGIVASRIEDIIQTDADIDRNNLSGPGILGSGIVDGVMAVFVDIYSLFSAAEPDIYQPQPKSSRLTDCKVLLAEDTAFFRTVEEEYLREFGCQVDVACDGREAWELLQQNDYELLVTDIQMPYMDGLELTRRVRSSEKHSKIPVMAVTSLHSDADKEAAIDAGVDYYELKLDRERLRSTMEQALGTREAR